MKKANSEKKNVHDVQAYHYNKYAIDDAIMAIPLTDAEKALIDKYF